MEHERKKRSVSATIKMTPADMELFRTAAATRWPGATITTSTMILDLARIGADSIVRGTIPLSRTLTDGALQDTRKAKK